MDSFQTGLLTVLVSIVVLIAIVQIVTAILSSETGSAIAGIGRAVLVVAGIVGGFIYLASMVGLLMAVAYFVFYAGALAVAIGVLMAAIQADGTFLFIIAGLVLMLIGYSIGKAAGHSVF